VPRPKHTIKNALGLSDNTPWACWTTLTVREQTRARTSKSRISSWSTPCSPRDPGKGGRTSLPPEPGLLREHFLLLGPLLKLIESKPAVFVAVSLGDAR